MPDAVALLNAYHAALNAYDFETVADCFAPDATYISSGLANALQGRTKIMAAFREYFSEFRDQIAVDEAIEIIGSLKVKSHWRLTAQSTLSGLSVVRRGIEVATFNADGFIVHIEVVDC